ncbi:MAG TPA: SRPBCC family protein [Opitutaceae bacterium]
MKINNEDYGKFTTPGEVRIVRLLPGPIERVWEYLTDSKKRARWFAGGPMEQKPGGKYELHFLHKNLAPDETPPEAMKHVHEDGVSFAGTVLRCEPPRVLSYTFDDESEVTFELTPQDDKVVLVLTHRSKGTDLPYLTGYAAGWHTHFMHLIAQLEGTPRPPFWSVHARLKAEYEEMRKVAQPS